MSVLLSIFLGIVQGITEFLPVSSSGHLSIFQNLFNLKYDKADHLLFDVLLHLGTLISIFIAYKSDLKEMVKESVSFLYGRGDGGKDIEGRLKSPVRMMILILIGTIPLVFVLPFYSQIESLFYNTSFIAFALIITGTLLFISDKLPEGKRSQKTMTVSNAVIIGVAQAIAVVPGLSRSGTTITVGLCQGLKRNFAVKFSFLLSIPAVIGSILITFFSAIKAGINWSLIPVYLLGMVIAAGTGYISIMVVRYLINKIKFTRISYYCWAVGVLTLMLSVIL